MERRKRQFWLAGAMLVLFILGTANASTAPTWSEEIANLPITPAGIFDAGGGPTSSESSFPERIRCGETSALFDFARSRRIRPALALCAGGRAWPIFATSYAWSVFGWPIAAFYPILGTSIVRLRLVWLILSGGTSLGLAYALARRLRGDRSALLAVGPAAASSAAVFLATLFFPYETFIWIWTATGCLTLSPILAGERPPATGRAALAGLSFGLATLTNVKALFLLAPLAVWACREVPVSRRLGWRWAVVIACAMPPPALLLWFAHVDPNAGLATETASRMSWATDIGRLTGLFREVLNAGTFGGDTGAFLASTATGSIERSGAAVWLVAAAIALCIVTALVRLTVRRGSPLSAACGLLLGGFVLVSALVYRHGIPANYSPIYPVFGVAVASAIFDVWAVLGRLSSGLARRSAALEAASVVVAMAILAWRAGSRIGDQRSLPTPMNVAALAEVAASAALRKDAPVVTLTEVHALTLDSLSDERVHTVQANAYFEECVRRTDVGDCVREHWRALLARTGRRPFQVLAPSPSRPHQHDSERVYAQLLGPMLLSEAQAEGFSVRTTRDFSIAGVVVMTLYLVEPAGA